MSLAAVPPAPTDLAWRVIGLVNLYRLLVPPCLYALYAIFGPEASLGSTHPELFLWTCVVYFTAGLAVVTARNLVHAALALIAAFFGVAILFVLLQAGFLATVQVVLYIGAIAILIIFAIMLTRRVMQDTGPQTNEQWWLSALLALALFVALWVVLQQVPVLQNVTAGPAISPDYLKQLGAGFVDPNQYLLPFELASVLLLVALVGSIVIAGEKQ
jgi:NADH-quinone oxidoreductase subunit J